MKFIYELLGMAPGALDGARRGEARRGGAGREFASFIFFIIVIFIFSLHGAGLGRPVPPRQLVGAGHVKDISYLPSL